jgi:hypothetical protein
MKALLNKLKIRSVNPGACSGPDGWKANMRCQTNTVNYSAELSLAQGIHFDR